MTTKKNAPAPNNNGGVTEEQIQLWKNRCRKVYAIEIEEDGQTHTGYFRRPDMETLSAVSKLGKSDEVKAANALFDNCWLGGSALLREDAVLRMAVIGQLNGLMEVARASLKNL